MKKSLRIIALLMVAIMVFALAACGQTKQNTAAEATPTTTGEDKAEAVAENEEAKSIKIGFSIPTEREERWQRCVQLLQEKVAKLPNAELIVQSADNDSQKQYSQIENMITQGIDVLLVAPEDSGSVGPVLDRCHEEGIYVIGYTRTGDNCWMDAYMTFDFETIGKYQAEVAVETAPKGNYVLCLCDDKMTSIAVPMKNGTMSVLQPYIDRGDIKIVLEHAIPNVDASIAMADVENALAMTNNDIQAIIAINDSVAGGCISALASAGLDGKVYVSGMDAEKTALKRILDGTQTMTTMIDLNVETDIAMELIQKLVSGEPLDASETFNNGLVDIPQFVYPPMKITKDNIQSDVIDAGFYTLEEIQNAE